MYAFRDELEFSQGLLRKRCNIRPASNRLSTLSDDSLTARFNQFLCGSNR
jgi:hypothetical protein